MSDEKELSGTVTAGEFTSDVSDWTREETGIEGDVYFVTLAFPAAGVPRYLRTMASKVMVSEKTEHQ